MTITKENLEKIYDEVERRINIDIKSNVLKTEREIKDTRSDMMQGVYSALMTIADNWEDVVWYIDEEEKKRLCWN